MGDPVASVEIQAKSSGLRAQLREARAALGQFADGAATAMGGAFERGIKRKNFSVLGGGAGRGRRGGGILGGAASSALGNIGAQATSQLSSFVEGVGRDVFDFEKRLTRLKIQAGETPEEMDKLSRSIRTASDDFGVSKSDILAGAEAFVTLTGRMDIAKESADDFAKIAQATGSEVRDIATAADALFQQFGIGAGDFERAFSGMTAQGKAGAIELKDMASELSTIAPQWAQFGNGRGIRGIRELGAAMQIVKKGFGGDAAETTTGLSNFLTAVSKKGARFRNEGVGSFFVTKNGVKQMKDVFTIVDQIGNSKLAKNPEKLRQAFGSIEAYRAYIQLQQNRAELERMTKIAEDGGVIQRDLQEYLASSSGRISRTWEQVKNDVAAALTPDRIQAAVEGFGELAKHASAIGSGLKFAADFFGGFKKAGQDIRGFITGEGRITLMDQAFARAGDPAAMAKIENIKANAELVKLRAADSPRARQLLGMKGVTSAADLAADFANAEGPGAVAKRRAAEQFFKERGMTPGVTGLAQQLGKMVDELKVIAANTAEQLQVKVGADPVATAAKNAPKHRKGVAK